MNLGDIIKMSFFIFYCWSVWIMNDITLYESLGMKTLDNYCKTYFARKKGSSHVTSGTVCQDYCLVENIGDDIQVVCVADGHGGEAYTKSDKGSYIACTVFFELVKNIKNNCEKKRKSTNVLVDVLRTVEFKKVFIQSWKQKVVDDYKCENVNSKETIQSIIKKYGTTFLFMVACKDYLVLGQLGDGAIMLSNDFEQQQLFKRHSVKTTSATSSLASNRAEFAFVIDIYEKKYFSSVLLSTDGIYDKLDTDNSFSLYEKDLTNQINEYGELRKPFMVSDIDVSEITKDDCTISLTRFDNKSTPIVPAEVYKIGYDNIRFLRYKKGIVILEGEKEKLKYEIHILRASGTECDFDLKSVKMKKADNILKLGCNFYAYIYSISDTWHRVGRLIDGGEHLEKRYWFNDSELSLDDDPVSVGGYSNEYWLGFYEQMLLLENELTKLKISVRDCFDESLFITENQEIVILSDSLMTCEENSCCDPVGRLLSRFSIIGKLSCGKISIPLFETATQGQSIVMLHIANERKILCKVIYNPEKKILGLWNATSNPWNTESGKRKSIPEQGVMRLNKDQCFYVAPEEAITNPDAEFVDGYAKYQVKILRR